MVIKYFFLLILLAAMVSCGARDRSRSGVLLMGQSSSGMPQDYLDKYGLISTLSRQDMFLDTDKDKIRDRDDFDIDNDGVPNDCDHAPFDVNIGTADADQDRIPDFCDTGDLVQEEIFKKYSVLLNINELEIVAFNGVELKKVLAYVSTKAPMPSKELLTITLTDGLPVGEFGVYDGKWKSIRYRTDYSYHDEFPTILNSSWVLVHELFHFVAAATKFDYSKMTEGFPTKYSQVGKEEYYAEEETFKYFFP
jgi:hypothetical protein